jgi:methyl-accepting chemotaxis protein
MNVGLDKAKVSVVQARKTGEALSEINNKVNGIVQQNNKITEYQKKKADDIVSNMNKIREASSITVENSRQVNTVSLDLANLASTLEDMMNKFEFT